MTPQYVTLHISPEDPIAHEWSDWDPYELIEAANDDTARRLRGLSLSGMLSFAVGCIEWVTYRCAYDPDYRLPFEYIEAFWVYLAGIDSALPDETTDDDRWEGPRDGPINLVLGKFYTTNHTYDTG